MDCLKICEKNTVDNILELKYNIPKGICFGRIFNNINPSIELAMLIQLRHLLRMFAGRFGRETFLLEIWEEGERERIL